MSTEKKKRRFSIKEAPKQEQKKKSTGSSVEEPTPTIPKDKITVTPVEQGDVLEIDTACAGLFQQAGHSLIFLSSAMGSGILEEADVRRSPEGTYWVEMDIKSQHIAHLIWLARGRPFKNMGNHWVPVNRSGSDAASNDQSQSLKTNEWPEITPAELLNSAQMQPGRYIPTQELEVIIPGSLGQVVLKRVVALNLDVTITPALKQRLNESTEEAIGVLSLHIKAAKDKQIPSALVKGLNALPAVFVGNAWESGGSRLLIDVRYRSPIAPPILGKLVPEEEVWILGAPEDGHWRLELSGEPVDGSTLLQTNITTTSRVVSPSESSIPKPVSVKLVNQPSPRKTADAILLDEKELPWLVSFLKNRPVEESAFLFPGSGKYLLTAPGGLSNTIPFGIPLSWLGPGGFYLEMGKTFYPNLPESARAQQFELSNDSLVSVCAQGAYRFQLDQMIPAWTLWIGDAPEIKSGLSRQGVELLQQISARFQKDLFPEPRYHRFLYGSVSKADKLSLLKAAQLAEAAGNLLKAAQLLEKAGYPGPAGRLYERAAH